MTSTENLCGHSLSTQGLRRGPYSPCVLIVGHDGYHEDERGLPFGPWMGEK